MDSDPKIEKRKENNDFINNLLEILSKYRQQDMPLIFKALLKPEEFEVDRFLNEEYLKSQKLKYEKLIEIIVDQSFRIEALEHELRLLRDLMHEKDRHAHASIEIEKKLGRAGADKRMIRYEPDNKIYEEIFHSMCLNDYKIPTREEYLSELQNFPRGINKTTINNAKPNCVWPESTASRKWRALRKNGHL